jgi:hypothetical protein
MTERIFMKFGMDVIPLEINTKSKILISSTLQYQRDECSVMRRDDDANTHDPLRTRITGPIKPFLT